MGNGERMMPKQEKQAQYKVTYPYIRAWGEYMGSMSYYINDERRRAEQDNAPATALHRKTDGSWFTLEEIQSEALRRRLQERVDYIEGRP